MTWYFLGVMVAYVLLIWKVVDPWLRRLEGRQDPTQYARTLGALYVGLLVAGLLLFAWAA
jgi:membrane-anchored protein YejM (alkaline phosphatase superfamily)